jgi:CheY-like chemotaxis protein
MQDDHDRLMNAVLRLSRQVNEVAKIQAELIKYIKPDQSRNESIKLKTEPIRLLSFPSPSIIESAMDNPFLFHGPSNGVADNFMIPSPLSSVSPHDIFTSTSALASRSPLRKRCVNILVVEDDPVCQRLIARYLARLPLPTACTVVSNGQEALEAVISTAAHHRFDLILMDISMPVMDGVRATEAIRAVDAGVPIVSMTGRAGPEDVQEYLSAGMNDVLEKPFGVDSLGDLLSRHCRL